VTENSPHRALKTDKTNPIFSGPVRNVLAVAICGQSCSSDEGHVPIEAPERRIGARLASSRLNCAPVRAEPWAFQPSWPMSLAADQDDLAAVLARAFVRAWERYYLPNRSETVAEDVARPALAKHLVAMAKSGIDHEITLAKAGLAFLISLTPQQQASGPEQDDIIAPPAPIVTVNSRALHLRVDKPTARFSAQWRIRGALTESQLALELWLTVQSARAVFKGWETPES
jgi:hypothetical protein